jgi:hypothetical protein
MSSAQDINPLITVFGDKAVKITPKEPKNIWMDSLGVVRLRAGLTLSGADP